uniref:Uncharacterized protein n=1 Tax=Arundo donax TaxID=35708 RepID=A0A0A9DDF9_ARUDO
MKDMLGRLCGSDCGLSLAACKSVKTAFFSLSGENKDIHFGVRFSCSEGRKVTCSHLSRKSIQLRVLADGNCIP